MKNGGVAQWRSGWHRCPVGAAWGQITILGGKKVKLLVFFLHFFPTECFSECLYVLLPF